MAPLRRRPVAAALVPLVLLGASVARAVASEAQQPSAAAAARTYVNAIFHRDGATVCRLVDPATKGQLERVGAEARQDCAHAAALLIGYPHENMGVQFVRGRILAVGRVRTVTTSHHVYRGVHVRVRIRLQRTGYPTGYHGSLRPILDDVVWLTSTAGRWRTAKPSLSLLVAFNGEVLSDRYRVRAALQPPTR